MIYWQLFLTFLEIGAFTFGGGYAMLPLVQQVVEDNGWMSQEELVNFLAVSESTPGPFAVNVSTYVGAHMAGFFGAVCATAGVVLPSFVIILILAGAYAKYRESRVVKGVMSGLRPAVVGLIGAAVLSVGKTVFTGLSGISLALSAGIFCLALWMILRKKAHPILVIVLCAGIGLAAGYAGLI